MIPNDERILIFDFGSQYVQLIARRVREHNVFSQIVRCDIPAARVRELNPKGLILSGGPMSVYEKGAPHLDPAVLDLGIPILAICYGMQEVCQVLGGDVKPGRSREFGRALCRVNNPGRLLKGVPTESTVWMSHGDQVERVKGGFDVLASTDTCPLAAVEDVKRSLYGLQFHPEVSHTQAGKTILHNFLFDICACHGQWQMASFIERTVEEVREGWASTASSAASPAASIRR